MARKPLAERFWSKVEKRGPEQCWPWIGSCGRGGYGVIGVSGRAKRAHRVAYELAVGPIAHGQIVMHTCDNPPCCNPAHLLAGSPIDNYHDMLLKGRHPTDRAFFEYLKQRHPEMIRTSTRA